MMKKIVLAFSLLMYILSSCVQQMQEPESMKCAGYWAVVDEDDVASKFYFFDHGYIYIYESVNEYFVCDDFLWGVEQTLSKHAPSYKYSLQDGIIHYHNLYEDIHASLTVDGNLMMLGDEKCRRILGVKKPYYSTIILSPTNKSVFLGAGEDVEWEFNIENPVDGYGLEVATAPAWCGGTEGVKVEDGRIFFSVQPNSQHLDGEFVFTYVSAPDVQVAVNLTAPEIILDSKSVDLSYKSATYELAYQIKNRIEGAEMAIECDADWITCVTDEGGAISYSLSENSSGAYRTSSINLTYWGVTATLELTQACAVTRLNLPRTSEVLTCEAAPHSFDYRIIDELEGLQVQAESDEYWISDVRVGDGMITYSVDQNDTGAARSGCITLSYGVLEASYFITQSYSQGYAFWAGDWTFTDACGLVQKVTFIPYVADVSYRITGLFGFDDDDLCIIVGWDEESQEWKLENQMFGELLVMPAGWIGDAWLYGMTAKRDYLYKSAAPICRGRISENGDPEVIPFNGLLDPPYNRHFVVDNVTVYVYGTGVQDGQVRFPDNCTMTFPVTISPDYSGR